MPKAAAYDCAQLKSTGPIPKAHDSAQLNLSLATFTEFQGPETHNIWHSSTEGLKIIVWKLS